MSFPALSVSCVLIGLKIDAALVSKVLWSEPLSATGVTQNAAPSQMANYAFDDVKLGFQVRATVDGYIAWGSAPDASQAIGAGQSARLPIGSGETLNIFCANGDKLAWTAA